MRVKRLELLGFKSFSTKTLVQFEPGVTAIVGPNGSGKSNLVDGIRWVLGEHNPRDVRAPRLEDVIFNGTDHAAPLSMAQVSLTIDNERGLLPIPFTEVQVTRRVYRSGESECFINQSPCRLKDVQELFLGTGLGGGNYAIIEQGHIDLILSSKPQERRVVFEEASGIARYLTKKQETLRRLDGVEQDLLRAADITQEVKRQLSALERQATRARQYRTQWEQLKTWELRLAADELCEGEQAHQDVSARVSSLGEQRRRLEEERQRLLGSLEQCNATVAATQATLQQVRTHLVQAAGHVEQQTSQHTLKMTWIGEVTAQREGVLQEVVRLEERASGLNQQLVRLQEQAQMLANDTQAAQRRRAATSEALSQLEQSLAEGLARVEQGKAELFGAAALASQQRNALAGATLRAQQVDIQLNRAQEQRRALEERIDALAKRQQQLEEERTVLAEGHQGLQRRLADARESAAQAQARRQELAGRLTGVRERLLSLQAKAQLSEEVWRRHEGFPEAVKALLASPLDGVMGLLADLLDPQPGYEHALEAALGPLSCAVVVKDRQALRRCQEFFSANNLGGVQVLVLSDCPAQTPADTAVPDLAHGALDRLLHGVRHDAAYVCLAQWLLGSWIVIENLDALIQVPVGSRGAWVSRSGERWDGCSWQVGPSRAPTLVGRRRQWERAREEVACLEQDAAAADETCRRAETEWQSLVAHEERLKDEAEQLASELAKLDAQHHALQHEATRLREDAQVQELQAQELSGQQRELTQTRADLTQAVREAEARQQEHEAGLKEWQAQRETWLQTRQQESVTLAGLDASLASFTQRQEEGRSRMEDVLIEHAHATTQAQQKRAQVEELAVKAAELTVQVEEHRAQIARVTQEHQRLQSEADHVAQALREDEARRDQVMPSLLAAEQELLTATQALHEQESRLAQRAFRHARILERLQEVYRLGESDVLTEQASLSPLGEEERRSLAQQVEKLKAKLGEMGPVNLGSVEEYDELKQRLEFLQAQQQDLLKAQEDLRHAIQQINRTARAQFRETFTKIQQEFQHYFTRLFGGGQAELLLLDEEDVLESGIEIKARPPGKRPQSISLLSGGERALTAIALLFALFKVRPSPFCILDEIDAPLDEANVDRFTKVLEEFLSLSQFILITHNKKTITKADCLYGVTMEQPGISKIVSVKLGKSPKRSTPTSSASPEPSTEQAGVAA